MTRKADGTWDKSKLPSRHVTEGPARAPHRSYYYAMGLGTREIAQPFVGVASCWNEAAPCNTALMRQAHAVSDGVKAAGATPREFCTITVTDGIAMGHEGMKSSLVSRDVIADSVELTMRGHGYDALVGVAGCDKSLPGMMMAMLRLNVPSVFLYGGSILPGRWQGRDVTVVDVFEGVGMHSAGKMSLDDLCDLEQHACPGDGACGGQFTANTMACVSEAIGLALPLSAALPAPYESRDQYAVRLGRGGGAADRAATSARATSAPARRSRTPPWWWRRPAARPTAGCTCRPWPTSAASSSPCATWPRSSRRTPYLADLKPGGRYVAKDMGEAGGMPVLLKTLLEGGFIHGDCMTVTGKTIAENLADVKWRDDQEVIRPVSNPLSPTGGVVGLWGSLAPDGAIVKVAGMTSHRAHRGPARVFDGEEACFAAVEARRLQGRRGAGHPLRGAQGRPGHARDAVHHRRALRPGPGRQGGADHRRPLLRRHARPLRRPRRPGGPGRRPDRA